VIAVTIMPITRSAAIVTRCQRNLSMGAETSKMLAASPHEAKTARSHLTMLVHSLAPRKSNDRDRRQARNQWNRQRHDERFAVRQIAREQAITGRENHPKGDQEDDDASRDDVGGSAELQPVRNVAARSQKH